MASKQLLTPEKIKNIEILRSIIERKLGRTIYTRSRKRVIVQAKMIFSLILDQNGFSAKEIGRQTGYDHSSILHHIQTMKDLIDQDNDIRYFYLSTKEEFDNGKVELPLYAEIKDMPLRIINYLDGLLMENNQLKLEAKQLREIKSDRLASIFDLINNNTPVGTEYIIEKKIKRLLNV